MSSKKTYAVATIGIPDNERHVLVNIFKLSLHRTHAYTLATDPGISPEILLVDADDPQSMIQWKASRERLPAILVTKDKSSDIHAYCIRRPFVATRVLGTLDQVALKELKVHETDKEEADSPMISSAVITPSPKSATPPPVEAISERRQPFYALVVDDSRPVRKQIELELKAFGMEVDVAETGEEAFALLDNKTYDLIFLDVVLPGVDGYHVCRTIKKDKNKKNIPVVMLTGKSSPFDRVKGALAGCDTYLTKPVKQASFQKVVKKYMR